MLSRRPLAFCLFAGLASPVAAPAQWSSDPAVNLSVADAAGDQVQPKVAATGDGGAWIAWFDAIANGFDVRVQKLDVGGNEILAHNGVLVADRGFSSTQDYGLDVDASGNAVLAFRDDGGVGVQIAAAKVAPTGTVLWSIPLTSTTDFVAAPEICGTSDGGAVVAWTQGSDVRLQKLDASGNPLWGAGVTLSPGAGSFSVSDLHDAGPDAILSFVHQTGSFGSPRHLLAQKLDAVGALQWGAGHVAVFDGGSLQFGNFPDFVPDGTGGAVFSWYDAATLQLQCRAQRVLANGTEAFPHNGSAVSTDATRLRVSPAADFDAATNETYLFWEEQDQTQTLSGLYGQKLDATGQRQWTNEGKVVVPVGSDEITMVRSLTTGSGAFVFWSKAPGFGQDVLLRARLDAAGTIDLVAFDVASTASGKSRLDVARSTAGFAMLAWSDDRSDAGDVLAQNVNADGTLGGSATSVPAGSPPASLRLRAYPNPVRGFTRLDYAAPGAASVALDIYDVRGRPVRTGLAGSDPDRVTVGWDGRDDRGVPVASGVYFVRLRSDRGERTVTVAVSR